MSKIEDYKNQKELTSKIIRNLRYASGLKDDGTADPNIDKGGLDFYDRRVWDQDIPIYFHASYGYYGSSSGYSSCFPEMSDYIIQALNHYKEDIVNFAMEIAKQDEEKALIACKTEAEKILSDINKVMKIE